MTIRNNIKKIWAKISPSYRASKRIETRLESLQNIETRLESLQNIETRLESLQNIETRLKSLQNIVSGRIDTFVQDGHVYIHDYSNYIPKYRNSLKDSKIGEILEKWYLENKDKIIDLMKKFCSFKDFYRKIPQQGGGGITTMG